MLQVSLWTRIVVGIVVALGILIALPNVPQIRSHIPSWLPAKTVSLGLDLQGGSYLLLEIQFDKVQQERLENLTADIRAGFNTRPRIPYVFQPAQAYSVSVRVTDPTRLVDARKILDGLNPAVSNTLLSVGTPAYTIDASEDGTFVMTMTEAYRVQTQQQILAQSIQVVNRRIDETGTRESTVQQQGQDRILVQVPGLQDPTRLKELLGKTAKLTFQLVDEQVDPDQAQRGIVPIGEELLQQQGKPGELPPPPLVVQKRVLISGDRLTDASTGFDQRSGQPAVFITMDSVGARAFADVTKAYPPGTQRFAIVLDGQIISAPVMNDPILDGRSMIYGNFTTQSAKDLADLLRAGALPAPLNVIEERTVGAELGADSITAGSYAAIAGLILVVLFMIARYGLFGVFADTALVLNIVLLLAMLTLLDATLTLPGIAGIVLTMGMAVDANVLIYERIREEVRNGRSMLAAIDSGFKRAMATIIDANATHLIAALVLYIIGTGPVRGFAVTLGFGIVTSFFTAVMVTRLIVIAWLNIRRPRRLYI